MPANTERRRVQYTGTVQGVGFRMTALRIAQRYAVSGYVRNLSDGSVELVAEGTATELERFLANVAEAMEGNIRHADLQKQPATGEFLEFAIRH